MDIKTKVPNMHLYYRVIIKFIWALNHLNMYLRLLNVIILLLFSEMPFVYQYYIDMQLLLVLV